MGHKKTDAVYPPSHWGGVSSRDNSTADSAVNVMICIYIYIYTLILRRPVSRPKYDVAAAASCVLIVSRQSTAARASLYICAREANSA